MSKEERVNEYNSEPIKYCSKCFSVKIKYEESTDSEYCDDCGCSDVREAPVEEWERLYEKKYGHKFAVKNEDPKKSFLFCLPIEKLKTKVYESSAWREIIHAMYPNFPGGLGRADSVILFFDKLIKESRIDDFKLMLLKKFKF